MNHPESVAEVMQDVGLWWAIAGGWAIDIWIGEQTRDHHDVEVVVRREDQFLVRGALHEQWELFCLDPPGGEWKAWAGRSVEPPAFQLQVRSSTNEFDIFLENVHDDRWQFRRDERIRRPLQEVTSVSASGIAFVRPEVQLLYMAKSSEPKNRHDFAVSRPRLDVEAAAWLAQSLALVHPGHAWLDEL